MKKWFLFTMAILCCFAAHAAPQSRGETLTSKVVLQNGEGYFVLSDGSFWKAVGFAKRWRTPSEWWNEKQLVPKNYECVPNDWYLGAQIEIYSKYDNLEVNEANASNQEVLKRCSHLFVNAHTAQVLFAIALQPAEALVQLFTDAHADGHAKGLIKGRSESFKNATDIYNNGYAEGYKVGYKEGYESSHNNQQAGM